MYYSNVSPAFSAANQLVGLRAYYNLNPADAEKAKIQFSLGIATINSIENGYRQYLVQSEKKHKDIVALDKEKLEQLKELNEQNTATNCALYDILENINDMSSGIGINSQALLEQIRLANTGIQKLIEICKWPEFQKEKIYYFEQGLSYLKQTPINTKRYEDAIECLKKAYELDDKDYLVNYELGQIYLYAKDHINFQQAKYHLLKAYDYAVSSNEMFSGKIALHLGYCYYMVFNFTEAIKYFEHAYITDNTCLEAKNIQMECYSHTENPNALLKNLKLLADSDMAWLSAAMNNFNISKWTQVSAFIDSYKKELSENITNRLGILELGNKDFFETDISKNMVGVLYSDYINIDTFDSLISGQKYLQAIEDAIDKFDKQQKKAIKLQDKRQCVLNNIGLLKKKAHREDVLSIQNPSDAYNRLIYWLDVEADKTNVVDFKQFFKNIFN